MENGKNTLRDLLAFDRTYLANERTFLAYIRTAVGLIASGFALLKLFDVAWAHTAGVILMILAPVVLVCGIVRYIRVRDRLNRYTIGRTPASVCRKSN